MRLLDKLKLKFECWRNGHNWQFDSYGLTGDWIRCRNCNAIDEYIPGLHEPEGYAHDPNKYQEDDNPNFKKMFENE